MTRQATTGWLFQCRNLAEMLRRQADRLGTCTALRTKRHGLYHDLTWTDFAGDALACAAALADAGVRPGDRVGLLAENRVEWLIADMGILAAGAINVPPHAPLTAPQVHFQLADAGVRWLFVSTGEQLEKIQQVRAELPELSGVVTFDSLTPGGPATNFVSFLQHGRQLLPGLAKELTRRETERGPDDLATIMYTSGTTGNPKGVMLTHGNLLSNVRAILEAESSCSGDVQLSWLPYSHIYARTVDYYKAIGAGLTLALADSVETVLQNILETEPATMNAVPRFYEKVLAACGDNRRKLHDLFGPRMKFLCSGGAPLARPVAEAYQAAGLLLMQGYGLTESAPVISFNRTDRYRMGTVGPPLPGVEVRIAEDGEVLSRGPHIMKGYWNNPEATAEALQDGWLHTGDLGQLDADGFLTITGRKKELLVLSNGKKVVPNYLEGLLLADPCIDQVLIAGEGRSYLIALVVPQWDNLLRESGADSLESRVQCGGSRAAQESRAAQDGEYRGFLERRIAALLKDVSPWEQVKKVLVLTKPFALANDELTVSLKLRRNVILEHYRDELERLYEER